MDIHPVSLVPHARAAWTADGTPEALAQVAGAQASLLPKQVHGTRVERVGSDAEIMEADGLLTETPGLMVGVRTADCLPILVAHRTEPIVGAVHAGWRGLAGGILDVLDERITMDGRRLGDFMVFFGPAIGPCCYAVGQDVGRRFGRHFDGKYLDLKGFAREWLISKGLPAGAIVEEPACTRCTPSLPSYRRDPSCGRILTGIVIRNDNGCHP